MEDVRPTLAVVQILAEFLSDVAEQQYGYGLMRKTGFSGAKVYQIISRLHHAGWIERLDAPTATPESGGPPRITYRLRPDAVPAARRMVTDAQPRTSRAGGAVAKPRGRVFAS